MGLASRRQAETWISEGRVFVNGKVVTEQGLRFDPENDSLTIDGKSFKNKPAPKVYWLLNKPDFCLTARPTEAEEKETIFDLPKLKKLTFTVSPVGRLDYRTQGLLLLTNDGDLANRLCRPEFKVPRKYIALLNGKLTQQQLRDIQKGIELEDGLLKNVEIKLAENKKLGASKGAWYFVTVHEGRNRVVRRIFEHFGLKTVTLIRYAFGDIKLPDDLEAGSYIQLTKKQIEYLREVTT